MFKAIVTLAGVFASVFTVTSRAGETADVRLKFAEGATVEGVWTHKKTHVEKGELMHWDLKEPLAVVHENSGPLVLVPESYKREIEVTPIAVKTNTNVQNAVDNSMSEILAEVVEIQKLTKKQEFKAAYQKYATLKGRFPGVKFLDFIGASLSLIMGDKGGAKILAKRALEAHPEYADGKLFFEKINGTP